MRNILTFDIEEWFDVNYPEVNFYEIDYKKSNLENEVKEILDLCKKFGTKATFFVLGRVAKEKPHLIKIIHQNGHEIASHGYEHKLVYNLSPTEFREDLKKSLEVLESIIGEKVLGYRAPSWSITKETNWVYPIMLDFGLKYSASVFPIKTFLYGIPDASRFSYPVKIENQGEILEIPMSTFKFLSKNLPFSGGIYFRFLPLFFIKRFIKKINQKEKKPVIIYLHPREIDKNQPKSAFSLKEQVIYYWGSSRVKNKLENLLKNFSFGNIKSELIFK